MSGHWSWAPLALLVLGACASSGMGRADLRVTDEAVKDCRDGTCVEAVCVVTNVGISDGEAAVKVLWKGPTGEGEDVEALVLRAGQSVDITRTFERTSKATKGQVKIACEML